MAKVALLLRNRSLENKLALTGNLITNLTGNASFTAPNPPLVYITGVKTQAEALVMDIADLESALATKRSELIAKEVELDATLTTLAAYAENISTAASVLESAGFPLARDPQPVGLLPAPTNLVVEQGQTGACDVRWPREYGAKTFVAEWALTPDGPWTNFYNGTRARCTAGGLVSGQLYWFRVAAIGAAGQSDWSAPAPKRAA